MFSVLFFLGGGGGWLDSCLNWVEWIFNLAKMRITNKAGSLPCLDMAGKNRFYNVRPELIDNVYYQIEVFTHGQAILET